MGWGPVSSAFCSFVMDAKEREKVLVLAPRAGVSVARTCWPHWSSPRSHAASSRAWPCDPTQGPVEVGGLSPCLTPARRRGQSRTPLQSSAQERLWSSEGRGGPPCSLPHSPLACLLLGHLHCAETMSDPESPPQGRQHWLEELQLSGLELWAHLPSRVTLS